MTRTDDLVRHPDRPMPWNSHIISPSAPPRHSSSSLTNRCITRFCEESETNRSFFVIWVYTPRCRDKIESTCDHGVSGDDRGGRGSKKAVSSPSYIGDLWKHQHGSMDMRHSAPDDCQLPSKERRRAEHNVPGRMDAGRCYKLDRSVRNSSCELPISAKSKRNFLCCETPPRRKAMCEAKLTREYLGGLLTNLAPTAVALAMYFCVADFLLISQCLYYNAVNARRAAQAAEENEEAPLLGERHHRRSVSSEDGTKIGPAGDELLERSSWMSNTASLIGVYVAGFIGWYLSYKAGAYREADPVVFNAAMQASPDLLEKIGIILGYFSAVCYLCARVPQIIKNYREKSCEGLSILFFMLSLTGNLTYAVSIVAYSQEKKYIINTIPWLIGSLGTVVEDGTIFVQFRLYANNRRSTQA